MIEGAVAQVLEYMRLVDEARRRHPADALAAHLRQVVGVALHPGRHEMAADAGVGAAALRHPGRGIVRAARAKIRRALDAVGAVRGQRGAAERGQHVRQFELGEARRQPVHQGRRDARGPQLAQRRQQRLAVAVGLADHHRAALGRQVVEQVLDLLLDDRALFFDYQDFFEPVGKGGQAGTLEGESQAWFVHPHAQLLEPRQGQTHPLEGLDQVEIGLAGAEDADARMRRGHHQAVDRIGAGKGLHRL